MRGLTVGLSLAIILIGTPARASSLTLSSLNGNLHQALDSGWTNVLGADLTFNLNNVSPSSNGPTGVRVLQSFGGDVWNNPAIMSFGTTGQMSVAVSNATFGLLWPTDIGAQFKRLEDSTLPPDQRQVPEPASSLLLATGAGILALVRAGRPRSR